MKKNLIVLVVLSLIIPQVTFAAWWNPFTWFSKPVDTKTQVLESRVKELESKLNSLNGSSTSTQTVSTTTPSVSTPVSIKEKPVVTKKVISVPVMTAPATAVNYEEKYQKLLADYVSFRDNNLEKPINLLEGSKNLLETDKEYLKYLKSIFSVIKSDVASLVKVLKVLPKPVDIVDGYFVKLNSLVSEYNQKNNAYQINRTKELESNKNAEQESALLQKQNYIRDLKIKIAEMDLFFTQTRTLQNQILIPITSIDTLNNAKKIDNSFLFENIKNNSGGILPFPYKKGDYAYSSMIEALQNTINIYKAYLLVEIAKNEQF